MSREPTGNDRLTVNPDALAPPTGSPDTPFYGWVCKRGNMIFLSGMSPYTSDKQLVEGNLSAHARQAFANMQAALEAVDARMSDVCSITIYVHDPDLQTNVYPLINPVCREYFGDEPPARAVVGGDSLPRPSELVMISAVACVG